LARCLAGVRAAEDPLLLLRSNRSVARMSDMDATTMLARDPWLSRRPQATCIYLASAEALNLRPHQCMYVAADSGDLAAAAAQPLRKARHRRKDALKRVRYRPRKL
jgi:hypothetical protein